jgi:4-hydroxythreonine-4-phosphate dehydrogenase
MAQPGAASDRGEGGGKPRVAVVLGDPTGIGPELTPKLLAQDGLARQARVLVVADRDELKRGAEVAGLDLSLEEVGPEGAADFDGEAPRLLHFQLPDRPAFRPGEATAEGGRYALESLKLVLDMASAGRIDAICFAPLNKQALHMAGMAFEDELRWVADHLGFDGYISEINVLEELWTSRVTSHVALKEVAGLITADRVLDSVRLIHGALRSAGVERPRIAVAALNPHAGDGGTFGREEIDVLGPAVDAARAEQMKVDGPFPSDTLFLKALKGEYDGVVTMYHDQGQIAMKLTGFERGASIQGGLPIAVTTPSHGTAYDIVGTGQAKVEAMTNAFRLACRMGLAARQGGESAG